MKTLFNFSLMLGLIFSVLSCQSSMSPMKVNQTLPGFTESQFVNQTQADKKIQSNECAYLVKERTYVAPVGSTPRNELKRAAKGIDEWVEIDGGNAYVLTSYKWIRVDKKGTTQLHVDFDTMTCK